MCNRDNKAERKLLLDSEFGMIQPELEPRYSIDPTHTAPIVLVRDGALTPQDLRRGFEGFTGKFVMNARAETAHEKRMFRDAWRRRYSPRSLRPVFPSSNVS
jgi:putative SOS response-associated peptidase YedK